MNVKLISKALGSILVICMIFFGIELYFERAKIEKLSLNMLTNQYMNPFEIEHTQYDIFERKYTVLLKSLDGSISKKLIIYANEKDITGTGPKILIEDE